MNIAIIVFILIFQVSTCSKLWALAVPSVFQQARASAPQTELSQKLQKLKLKRLFELTQDFSGERGIYKDSLYIPSQASCHFNSPSKFNLEPKIMEYLQEGAQDSSDPWKVLLLMGNAASGKTIESKRLERELWSQWQSRQNLLPLFISLPSIENREMVIEETLEKYGFSKEEIEELKARYRFVFILDGYDELTDYPNLYQTNDLKNWHGRVLITTRYQHFNKFGGNYEAYLYPYEGTQPQRELVKELFVSPFGEEQRMLYLRKYIEESHGKTPWPAEEYERFIKTIGGLEELVQTPFVLKMVVEVLPIIVERHLRDEKLLQVSINEIYDEFIEQWFNREIEKYEQEKKVKLAEPDKIEKRKKFRMFCQQLASKMHGQGISEVKYKKERSSKVTRDEWQEFFDSHDEEIKWCLHACPLMSVEDEGQIKWSFLHKTLQEYFVSQEGLGCVEERARIAEEVRREKITKLIAIMNASLVQESLIHFLADAVNEKEEFKQALFEILEISKRDEHVAIAAANAITALNAARVSFSGMDLSGIRIPGADLTGAIMDSTILRGADLRNVKFIKAWLRNANLSGSNMEGVEFGERTRIFSKNTVSIFYFLDKKILVTGGGKGDVTIWNTLTGDIIYKFKRAHKGVSWDIVCSHDGKKFVTCGADGVIQLWDVNNDDVKHIKSFTVFGYELNRIWSIAWLDDEKILVFGCRAGVFLLNIETNKIDHILQRDSLDGSAISVRYCPNSNMLITANVEEGFIQLWDMKKRKEIRKIKNPSINPAFAAISLIDYVLEGKMVVIGGADGIWLWDTEKGDQLEKLNFDYNISCIKCSFDGKKIAIGCTDGSVWLWDLETNVKKSIGHCVESILRISFSFDDLVLATIEMGGDVYFWEIGNKKEEFYQKVENIVWFMTYSCDRKGIVLVKDKDVWLYDVEKGKKIKKLISKNNMANILAVEYFPNEEVMALGTTDGSIFLYDIKNQKILFELKGHHYNVMNIKYSPNGDTLVSEGIDFIRLWDLKTRKEIKSFPSNRSFSAFQYSPNGEYLCVAIAEGIVLLLDSRTGEKIREFKVGHEDVMGVCFSPDGKKIAAGGFGKKIKIWGIHNGEEVCEIETTDGIFCIQYLPDGEKILAGDSSGVSLFDINTKKEMVRFEHQGRIGQLLVFRNGKILASRGLDDHSVKIWTIKDGLLRWSFLSRLIVRDLKFLNVQGLSSNNFNLLKQSGAIGEVFFDDEELVQTQELNPLSMEFDEAEDVLTAA